MSLTRFVLPGLMLGLVLSFVPSVAKATPASAVSGVVFGNLGTAGTDDPSEFTPTYLINTTGTTNNTNRAIAQAFNTGSATFGALKLNSVTLAVYGQGTNKTSTLKIYSGTTEPTTLLGTSDPISVLADSKPGSYTYFFSVNPQDGVQLIANTQYWVSLETSGVYWADSGSQPTNNLNGSTYTYSATSRKNGSNTWVAASSYSGLGISVNVVPEPSTYAMAGIGVGLAGLAQLRRRKR